MEAASRWRRIPAAHLFVGAVVAAVLAALAFQGGAFDVVPRQTAALLLWWLVIIGALVFARDLRWPAAPVIAATAFGAGIALWAGLGAGASLSTERSAIETARGVAHLAPIVLVGWILPRHLWRAVVVGVALGGTIVCLAALGERLSPGFLEDTRTIVFLNATQRLAAPLGYWNAVGSWGVLTSLLLLAIGSHATHLAARAAALLPLPAISAVIYVTYSRSALASAVLGLLLLVAFSRNRWTTLAHAAALAVIAVVVAGAIEGADAIANATGGAGAGDVLLPIVVGGVLLAALGALTGRLGADRLRIPERPAKVVFAIGLAAAVVGAGVGVASYGSEAWDKFSVQENADAADPTSRLTMINNGSRVEQWKVAWDSWQEHRWQGTGAGTFELTYNREGNDGQFVRDAHSAYLEALSEQGLIGFGLLLGFVLTTLWMLGLAMRRVHGAVDRGLVAGAGAAVCAFFFGSGADWFWEVTALAMLAMTLVGALAAATARTAVHGGDDGEADSDADSAGEGDLPLEGEAVSAGGLEREAPAPRRGWGTRVLPAGLVVLGLVAVLVELPGLVGTSEVRRSQQAVTDGDLTAARDHADRAIDTMPWASSPFLQRGLVDEQAGAYDAATEALELAVRRDPYDWRLPLVLARIEAKNGDPKAALAAYRQAKEQRPMGKFFR